MTIIIAVPIIPKPSRPSIRDKFDEDWEVGSNSSDQLIIDEEGNTLLYYAYNTHYRC